MNSEQNEVSPEDQLTTNGGTEEPPEPEPDEVESKAPEPEPEQKTTIVP